MNLVVCFQQKFYIGNSIVNFLISCQIAKHFGKLRFLIEFFMESPWVFSYDLENSRCCQNVIQRAPIHCESYAVQIYSQFWKILGFIAWRFHIDLYFLKKNNVFLFLAGAKYWGMEPGNCHQDLCNRQYDDVWTCRDENKCRRVAQIGLRSELGHFDCGSSAAQSEVMGCIRS